MGSAGVLRRRGVDYADFNRAIGFERPFRCLARRHRPHRRRFGTDSHRPVPRPHRSVPAAAAAPQVGRRRWPEPKRAWVKLFRHTAPPDALATEFTVREALPAEAAHLGQVACAGFGMPPALSEWWPL